MATRSWLGQAKNVTQISTITITGTWAGADTITVTIGNLELTITVGSLTTTAQVATTLKQAWNGEALTDTTAACTPTIAEGGAVSMGPFSEITATVNSNVVTLTANTSGVPFTAATTKSSTSGNVADATTTNATGRHFFNNADNWSGNAVPIDNDAIVFATGNVSCKYGLTPAIQPASVTILRGYTGEIGLPPINTTSSSKSYSEYRTTHLTFDDNSVTCTYSIGSGIGNGSKRIRIDAGPGQSVVNVWFTAQRAEESLPAFTFIGTHASNVVNCYGGDTGIAATPGESATVQTVRSAKQSGSEVPRLLLGTGCTITNMVNDGGQWQSSCASTNVTINDGEHVWLTGAIATLRVNAGIMRHFGASTITTLHLTGKFDRSGEAAGATITNAVEAYRGASLLDPSATLTLSGGVKLNGCRLGDITLDLGIGRTVTVA